MISFNRLLTLLLIFFLLFSLFSPQQQSLTTNPINQFSFPLSKDHSIIIRAVNYLKNQQNEDGSIGGLSVSSWVAMAFASVNDNSYEFDRLTSYLLDSIEELQDSEKATDWQRHILGIFARNNSQVRTKNQVLTDKLWSFYHNHQFGEENNIYDDCFGLFSLTCLTNRSINQTVLQNLQFTILEKQQSNGGWNDVDTTTLAIMALRITGLPNNASQLLHAYHYLKNHLNSSGGFTSWGSTNTASTAWAISALNTFNETMKQLIWNSSSSPLEYLLRMQQPDGSFNYTESSKLHPEWMTAYAIIALRGKSYPVTFFYTDDDQTNEPNDSTNDEPNEQQDEEENNPTTPNQKQNHSKNNQPYFYIRSPHLNGIYINNFFISMNTKKPILIGNITISIKTNAPIDQVLFSINDRPYQKDQTSPFSFTYQSTVFFETITVKAYGFAIQKNLTEHKLISWIQQLQQTHTDKTYHLNKSYLQNLKEFTQWLIPLHYEDFQSYLVLNPTYPFKKMVKKND